MDNNSEIRKEAMKCIIYVVSNIHSMSEQLKTAFKELILPMLQVSLIYRYIKLKRIYKHVWLN